MSKRLATIARDVPIEFSLEAVQAQEPDTALLKAIYKELEFHSLLKELGPGEDARARDYRVFESPERAAGVAGRDSARHARGRRDFQIRRRRIRAGYHRPGMAAGRGARGDRGKPGAR